MSADCLGELEGVIYFSSPNSLARALLEGPLTNKVLLEKTDFSRSTLLNNLKTLRGKKIIEKRARLWPTHNSNTLFLTDSNNKVVTRVYVEKERRKEGGERERGR